MKDVPEMVDAAKNAGADLDLKEFATKDDDDEEDNTKDEPEEDQTS